MRSPEIKKRFKIHINEWNMWIWTLIQENGLKNEKIGKMDTFDIGNIKGLLLITFRYENVTVYTF